MPLRAVAGWILLGFVVAQAALAQGGRNLETSAAPGAQKRVALVIGNNDYRHVSKLERAVSDARTMASELRRVGFEVLQHANLDRRGMNQAVGELVQKAGNGGVAVLFFAGHGVQVSGANYLLPVDIKVGYADDLVDDAVDLGRVMERLAAAQAKFTLLIVDACRDNPFPRVAGRSVGGSRGLTIPAAPDGLMVVYSAGVNEQALDRLSPTDRDPNGLFTREFVKQLRTPGVRVDDMVRRIRASVREQARQVGHAQNPAIYDQSSGDFYFVVPSGGAQLAAVPATPAAPSAPDPLAVELSFWDSVKDSRDPREVRAYLDRYPNGQFVALASARLGTLHGGEAANERMLWDSVKDSRDPAELKAYLDRHPNGLFASVAATRLKTALAAQAISSAPADRLNGSWVSTGPGWAYVRIEAKGQDFKIFRAGQLEFQGTVSGNSISGVRFYYLQDEELCGKRDRLGNTRVCNVSKEYPMSGELAADGSAFSLSYQEPEVGMQMTGVLTYTFTFSEKSRKNLRASFVREKAGN